jgi:general secretion pathway protein M
MAPLAQWWSTLAKRERSLVTLALVVLVLGLLWSVAVYPAWRTLQRAPAELDQLDAQLQQMQVLAAEAQQLRDTPPVAPAQAQASLKAATERLGPSGKLALQGDRAVLTLTGAEPRQLREWLAEVRAGARARPVEATLQRGAQGFTGSLVVQLGAAP